MREIGDDVYERDMRDVERIGEPAAKLAQLHHAGTSIGVCATKNDKREKEQYTRGVIDTI